MLKHRWVISSDSLDNQFCSSFLPVYLSSHLHLLTSGLFLLLHRNVFLHRENKPYASFPSLSYFVSPYSFHFMPLSLFPFSSFPFLLSMDMFVLEYVPSFDLTIEYHTLTKPKLVSLYAETNVSIKSLAKP